MSGYAKNIGKPLNDILPFLTKLIKFFLEEKLKKEILVSSDNKKITFTEEINQPCLCGLYIVPEHPNTNLDDEIVIFMIFETFKEKHPEIFKEFIKIVYEK